MDWHACMSDKTVNYSPVGITASNVDAAAHRAWYVVHTKPRLESVALENLERQNYTCYLPLFQREVVRRGKVQTVTEPLFARYLFIQLDSSSQGASWSPIRSTTGVSQLVRFGTTAAKVDEALIAALRERQTRTTPAPRFAAGDAVYVSHGPLAGLEAIYQCTDAQHRAIVLLNLLGQSVRTQMDAALLRARA